MSFAQNTEIKYFDTLFYKEGIIKPCTIRYVDGNTIHFNKTTKKGLEVKATTSTTNLIYYVDYDSTGTVLLNPNQMAFNEKDPTKFHYEMIADTVLVPQHHLSINPFSLPLLGLNLDYMYRFRRNGQLALHIPFRATTWFGTTFVFNTGLGLNFIPYNSEKSSVFVGLSSQVYMVEGYIALGFPLTFGFVRNLTDLLTINGYAGIGPFISADEGYNGFIVPDAHIGIGFKFGEYFETTNKHKVKVPNP